ncbi:UNVERIFIED_CONTAM: hypothetical protein FKN15_045920 [Acipenser sinensis]
MSICAGPSVGRLSPAVGGAGSVSPAVGGAGSVSPAVGGAGSVSPAVGGAGSVSPAVGGAGSCSPAVGGAGSVSPAVEGAGSVSPAVEGAGSVSPAVGGAGSVSLAVGGTGSFSPAVGGAGSFFPAVGGAGSFSPAVGGAGNEEGGEVMELPPPQPRPPPLPAVGGAGSFSPAVGGAGNEEGGEVMELPPPQPRPPPLQASPALPWEVPCPGSVDTGPECTDLPPLDLAPRSQDSQAQSPAWSLAPLPLDFQISLRRRKTSLCNGQTSLTLPLLVASFPLPTALLPLESQTSLRRSTATRLCLPVRAPGHRPALWSPWTCRLGPSLLVLGPSLGTPEGPTHPQARPWKRAKIDIYGLGCGWSFKGGGRWPLMAGVLKRQGEGYVRQRIM